MTSKTRQTRTIATVNVGETTVPLYYAKTTSSADRTKMTDAYDQGIAAVNAIGTTLFRIALALTVCGTDLTGREGFTGSFASQVRAAAAVLTGMRPADVQSVETAAVQIGQRASAFANGSAETFSPADRLALLRAVRDADNSAKSAQAVGKTWGIVKGWPTVEAFGALRAAATSGDALKVMTPEEPKTDDEQDPEQAAADAIGSAWERADRAVRALVDAWPALSKDERKELRVSLQSLGA